MRNRITDAKARAELALTEAQSHLTDLGRNPW